MDKVEQLEERNTKNSIKIRMLEEMGKGYDKTILNLKKAVKKLKKNESKDREGCLLLCLVAFACNYI
jgi:uncharacterized protein (UPF0335 family)